MSVNFKCRSCNSDSVERVFYLDPIPLVGDFTSAPRRDVEKFEIDLRFCLNCSLLQLTESIDSDRLFRDYFFSSSTIPALVEHFSSLASWIENRLSPGLVLEVGCNDGILLEPLKRCGIDAFGVDISENITRVAKGKGLNVKNLKFGTNSVPEVSNWVKKEVDVISASNTFPHNSDPNDFLRATKSLLSHKGALVLEVMYAGSLSEKIQWDTVYHEHLNFYSLESLENLLAPHGLFVNHAEVVPMHAGSLRIIASRKAEIDKSVLDLRQYEEETKLNTIENWIRFGERSIKSIQNCRVGLRKLSESGSIWAYGAAGRASMWLNVCSEVEFEFVLDSSPFRIGRFIPGTGIPIVDAKILDNTQPGAVFVTAWNYSEVIISKHQGFKGIWVLPLPTYEERKH